MSWSGRLHIRLLVITSMAKLLVLVFRSRRLVRGLPWLICSVATLWSDATDVRHVTPQLQRDRQVDRRRSHLDLCSSHLFSVILLSPNFCCGQRNMNFGKGFLKIYSMVNIFHISIGFSNNFLKIMRLLRDNYISSIIVCEETDFHTRVEI